MTTPTKPDRYLLSRSCGAVGYHPTVPAQARRRATYRVQAIRPPRPHLRACADRVHRLVHRPAVAAAVMGEIRRSFAGGGFGPPVTAVVGLGIKVAWSDEELARARALADRPPGTPPGTRRPPGT